MSSDPNSRKIPESKPDERTPFERFEDLTRKLVNVPKTEIDKLRRPRT